MTSAILNLLSWICLVGGGFFVVVAAIGLHRMPDVFSRMHAVSVGETLGAGLLILGMVLQAGPTLVAAKLVIIALVLFVTGPVAAHALARAALHDGIRPLLADEDGRLAPTDPDSLFPGLGARLAAPAQPGPEESVETSPSNP